MTKKTKYVGQESGGMSTDQWLSPSNPYTGDGRTKRSIFDRLTVVFKTPKGK